MAKEDNTWTGIFMFFLSLFMIVNSIQRPLSPKDHQFIEGKITNLEKHKKPKRRSHHTFSIDNLRYKGKVFNNTNLLRIANSSKVFEIFKEKKLIGFHVEKKKLKNKYMDIYSLTLDGKIIVPLEKKWQVKYWNIAIGFFLLVGSFYLIKGD